MVGAITELVAEAALLLARTVPKWLASTAWAAPGLLIMADRMLAGMVVMGELTLDEAFCCCCWLIRRRAAAMVGDVMVAWRGFPTVVAPALPGALTTVSCGEARVSGVGLLAVGVVAEGGGLCTLAAWMVLVLPATTAFRFCQRVLTWL